MKFYAVLNKRERGFADRHPESGLAKIDSRRAHDWRPTDRTVMGEDVLRCVRCGDETVRTIVGQGDPPTYRIWKDTECSASSSVREGK